MPSSPRSSQHRRVKKTQAGQPRARPINSCLTCRDRKKGCDKRQPICSNCVQNPDPNKPCVYYALGKAEVLKIHKRKMQSLKEDFACNVANGLTAHSLLVAAKTAPIGDADSEFTDLDVRLGKLRISDRVGGAFFPITVEELTNTLEMSTPLYPEQIFLSHQCPSSVKITGPVLSLMTPSNHRFRETAENDMLLPDFPDRSTSEILLAHYWESVHPVARVLHRPSFTRQWMTFWESHELGKKINNSSLALIFAIFFAASVSMPDDVARNELKYEKNNLIRQMRAGAENTMARTNWIHVTHIEALQAVVIHLITVCREDVTHAQSSIVAAAIRTAEGIGLHKDGTLGDYTAIQIHTRRLLWYQLLVLDIRTSEATGPRPQKRKEDFSTVLPLNIDENLIQNNAIASHGWTDMTATIVRFRCNEFIRDIWSDCLRLKDEQIRVDEVLINIRTFEAQIRRTYEEVANPDVPIQKYSCLVARILISGTYAMALRQYAIHPHLKMSENLKRIFIQYGVHTMDAVRELETSQDLDRWRWLSGAIQQHQNALAMLLELLKNPYMDQAMQIMKGLDYVFEPPVELASMPLTCIRCIATQLRDHMNFHANLQQSSDSHGNHGLQDVPELDHIDSSTCSRSATPGDSSPNLQGNHSDEQQASAALRCDFIFTQRSKMSCPDQGSDNPAFPSRSVQSLKESQRQIIDIDAQTLARYFPGITEGNPTTNTEERHTTYDMDSYIPNLPFSTQFTTQDPGNENHIENTPNSSHYPETSKERFNMPSEDPPNPYPTFYNIDDFTGYCEYPPFTSESYGSKSESAALPPTHHQAAPFHSFPRAPDGQFTFDGGNPHHPLPHQAGVQPFPEFTPYAQSTPETLFQGNGESSTQSSSQPQLAHQGYYGQFSERIDYSMPTYETPDIPHP